MKIDYGLKMLPDTVLYIANTEEFHWLLQSELKAIKDGLTYIEEKSYPNGIYRGYLNADGQREGVGQLMGRNGNFLIGEWHEDLEHGVVKFELTSTGSSWTQYKFGKREGYEILKHHDGRV